VKLATIDDDDHSLTGAGPALKGMER